VSVRAMAAGKFFSLSCISIFVRASGDSTPSGSKKFLSQSGSPVEAEYYPTIKLYQWNPHYECFVDQPDCAINALPQITTALTAGVDFANIIELEPKDDFQVPGFNRVAYNCDPSSKGSDQISFFYNSSRWTQLTKPTQACAPSVTRAFQVFSFASVEAQGVAPLKMVVAGAHFDHAKPGDLPTVSVNAVGAAMEKQAQDSGAENFIFLGDTNVYTNPTTDIQNALLANAPSLSGAISMSTSLQGTCCYNQGGASSFPDPFDRIFANFGSSMQTTVYDDPTPAWAMFSKFHRAIGGVLTV